ncbi:MAG: GAF domain-containing protein [Candidatus Omnitrophota bacterium]
MSEQNREKRYIEQLVVLNTIVREISASVAMDIPQILYLIYRQTEKLMDVTNFFVAFFDKDSNTVSFEFAVENGEPQKTGVGQWEDRIAGNGLTEHLIRNKKVLLIEKDVEEWIHAHNINIIGSGAKSWLGAPMMFKNEVLGVIVIQSSEKENAYDHIDMHILETIAVQAAIAIDKTRLFHKSKQQVEELNGLYKISQEIVTESMSIKSVLKIILEKAVTLSKTDGGQFLLYDETSGDLRVISTYNMDALKGMIFKKGEAITGKVAMDGISRFTNDYYTSEYFTPKLDSPIIRTLIKGLAEVPLKFQNKLLGVLALSYKPGSNRLFTQKDTELLNHFAGPASIAIAIARYISFQKTILNNSPDAIIAVDRLGIINQFNKTAERVTGYKGEDIIGNYIKDFYYSGEVEAKRINNILFESERKKDPARNIYTIVRGPKGDQIPTLLSGAILKNELAEGIGSIGFIKDLREIKSLDQEYRNQQIFLRYIEQYPQDSPINTFVELQRRITRFLEMTGEFCKCEYAILFASTVENDTVLKAVAWTGLPPNVEKALPHFNWRKMCRYPSDETDRINKWLPDDEWKHWINISIRGINADFFKNLSCGVPVRLANNYRAVLVLGPFKDDTFLLNIADFIRNVGQTISINALSWLQTLYLRYKNKESEIAKQLIVHRARMQLQQIIGKFGVIKRIVEGDSAIKKHADDGEKLVSHLAGVIKQGVTSHIGEMEPKDFDFQDYPLTVLIQNCVENFREKAQVEKRDLKLEIDSIEDLPYAEIDHMMLSVALGNLIENALKYSIKDTEIKIFSKFNFDKVNIYIQNYGEQMPEGARKNLVQPGMRWAMSPRARSIPGTGFGLWDASVIAAAHGGKLDFYSAYKHQIKAHEVRVWLTIPLKQDKH